MGFSFYKMKVFTDEFKKLAILEMLKHLLVFFSEKDVFLILFPSCVLVMVVVSPEHLLLESEHFYLLHPNCSH